MFVLVLMLVLLAYKKLNGPPPLENKAVDVSFGRTGCRT